MGPGYGANKWHTEDKNNGTHFGVMYSAMLCAEQLHVQQVHSRLAGEPGSEHMYIATACTTHSLIHRADATLCTVLH